MLDLKKTLVDQLFNLSERRLARLLIVLANSDREGEKLGEVNLSSGSIGRHGWHNPIPD